MPGLEIKNILPGKKEAFLSLLRQLCYTVIATCQTFLPGTSARNHNVQRYVTYYYCQIYQLEISVENRTPRQLP